MAEQLTENEKIVISRYSGFSKIVIPVQFALTCGALFIFLILPMPWFQGNKILFYAGSAFIMGLAICGISVSRVLIELLKIINKK